MVWSSEEPSFSIPTTGGFGPIIGENFSKWGNKLALVDGPTDKGYTYAELNDVIKNVAGNLYHQAGVRKGDVILVFLPNSTYFGVLMMAIPSIGGIMTGCNPLFTTYEVARQLNDSNALYLVTTSDKQHMIPELLKARPQIRSVYIVGDQVNRAYIPVNELFVPGRRAPEVAIDNLRDVAILPYSSGTTGLPKGVMITHHNIAAGATAMGPKGADLLVEGKETWVAVFPLYHIGGALQTFFTSLLCGTTLIFFPKYDFKTFLEANQKYQATFLGAPPPVFVRLAKDPLVAKYNLSSLKQSFMGGAPTSRETLQEVQRKIPTIKYFKQGYGLTESCGTTHYTRAHDIKLGSVGKVVPNVQYKIVDPESGKELPPNKDGEIVVRGDTVMKGYLNRPIATANTIKNGWMHTGDIGHGDETGHLFIVDRLKELIKYKGYQVPPAELEALLLTHPDVSEVAVTGVPDDQAGELPRAFIVLKEGRLPDEKSIHDFVKSRVAPYKQLRGGIEFVNEVPKSPSGKLLRRILKDRVIKAAKSKL